MIPLRKHPLFQQLLIDLATDYAQFEVTGKQLAAEGYTYDEMAAAVQVQLAELQRGHAADDGVPAAAEAARYRPDYGMFLPADWPTHQHHVFCDVPVTHISRSDTVTWTTLANYQVDRTEFAVSFDLSNEMFRRLLHAGIPSEAEELFAAMQDMEPGQSFDFVEPLIVTIEATLGIVVRLPRESFRPFVVRLVER